MSSFDQIPPPLLDLVDRFVGVPPVRSACQSPVIFHQCGHCLPRNSIQPISPLNSWCLVSRSSLAHAGEIFLTRLADPDPQYRARAAIALGQIIGPALRRQGRRETGAAEANRRDGRRETVGAAEANRRDGRREGVMRRISGLLSDEQWKVRKVAIEVLAHIGPPCGPQGGEDWIGLLSKRLADDEPRVAVRAGEILIRLGRRFFFPTE